jgi:hypothetical protein
MRPIDVRTASAYWTRVGCLAVIFGGIAAVMVVMGVKSLSSPYGSAAARWLILLGVAVLVVPFLVLAKSRLKWAARFDANGVTIRSGRLYPWPELQSVAEVRTRYGQINRYELVFRGGRARVFHLSIANAAEVMPVLAALRAGKNPFTS